MPSLHNLAPVFRLLSASLILMIAVAILYKGASDPIKAQQSPSAQQEREIENTVPKHVPLDIKVTKEKEKNWKDLNNENWAQDFELEIKNTGEKPIYTFYLAIFFDVTTEFASELIAGIYYGRPEISDPRAVPTADDVPIKPGESKVFRIHSGVVHAWEKGRREKGRPLPTKVRIQFESLTFGDGTGLMFHKAVPYPRKSSQTSKPGTRQQTARRREKGRSRPIRQARLQTPKTTFTGSLSAGKFLFAHSKSALSRTTAPPLESCPSGCDRRVNNTVVKCHGCPPQNDPAYDETGPCTSLSVTSRECTIPETGVVYLCSVVNPSLCETEPPPPPPTPTPTHGYAGCSEAEWEVCMQVGAAGCYDGNCYTPILIDPLGDGFRLTSAGNGVVFNLIPDLPVKIAWTTLDSDDAWLVLDRNRNGVIDSGHELFGNSTSQPQPPPGVEKNGFFALAEFDKAVNGGNGDRAIDGNDAVFSRLRLWQDTNHNGISEPDELHGLTEFGLESIALDYHEGRRRDQHGNVFRYRAKVYAPKHNDLGRWAYDVLLRMEPMRFSEPENRHAGAYRGNNILRLLGIEVDYNLGNAPGCAEQKISSKLASDSAA